MRNKENVANMENEFRDIKADLTDKFNNLLHRQMMQIEGLKYILEHSGSSRLKNLTKRILNEEYYDINKIQNKFITQDEDKIVNRDKQNRNRNNSRRFTNNIKEENDENRNKLENFNKNYNRTEESI